MGTYACTRSRVSEAHCRTCVGARFAKGAHLLSSRAQIACEGSDWAQGISTREVGLASQPYCRASADEETLVPSPRLHAAADQGIGLCMRLSRSDKESGWRGFGSRLMRSRAPFLRVDRTAIQSFLEFGNHSFSTLPDLKAVSLRPRDASLSLGDRVVRLSSCKVIYWDTIVNAPSPSSYTGTTLGRSLKHEGTRPRSVWKLLSGLICGMQSSKARWVCSALTTSNEDPRSRSRVLGVHRPQ